MLALSAPNFVLVQGVFYGLGYGLLALGLVLVYRTNRVLNFAQGQIGVIAAVFLVKLTADFKFNYWFALVLSIGLAAFVGALSELVLRRLFNRPRVLVMVATIGLSYVLLALATLPFIRPSNLYKPVPVPFDLSFSLGGFVITPTEVLTLIVAPITVERLMGMVRRINDSGTTVILVEQSLNRALSLADRCFFMERGEIRFDGPTTELMARDDLLRPVFLGTASSGLG